MSGEPNRAQRRAWPKRRQWADRIATDNRLTHGAKAWLGLLARRSDDQGKPVWGNQCKMAAQIGRSDRSVRRYRLEAEQLGYVQTFRSKPLTGPDGRFCRRKSNTYYLTLPARETAGKAAPRRKQRAPYCVVGPGKAGRRYLPDNDGRSSPVGVSQTALHPPAARENWVITDPEPDIPPMSVNEARAHARQNARAARPRAIR